MFSLVRISKTLLLTLVLSSCAALSKSPIEGTVGFRGGDRDVDVGSVGGGGDSVALWLAILGLIVTPVLGAVLYKYGFRPLRIWREKNGNGNGSANGKNGGSQGDKLCVEYSRWGPPSSHLPDVPHLGHLTDGIQKTNGK